MTLDDFCARALDVPFKIGGRDYDGWDCWGLIFCAYRDVFAIPIPALDNDYNHDISYAELMELVDKQRPAWLPIERPEVGAVSLYRVGRYHSHVALVLPHGRMLHCEHGAGSICERLDNLVWRGRHVGYFKRRQHVAGSGSAKPVQD